MVWNFWHRYIYTNDKKEITTNPSDNPELMRNQFVTQKEKTEVWFRGEQEVKNDDRKWKTMTNTWK